MFLLIEQAAYFGNEGRAIKLGEEAKVFTATVLQKPFTIQTRWRKVFGPTLYYACVYTGNDLAELLLRSDLARIYGTRTPLPNGTDSRTYLPTLRDLEQQAKSAGLMVGEGGRRRDSETLRTFPRDRP